MKVLAKSLISIFVLFLSFQCFANSESPFLDGQLNLELEGELTALAGEVIDKKDTKQKYPVYKLNLRLDGVGSIWVTSIGEAPVGGINIGDMMIFKGYISSSEGLDPSGELEKLINSKSLLLALKTERAN